LTVQTCERSVSRFRSLQRIERITQIRPQNLKAGIIPQGGFKMFQFLIDRNTQCLKVLVAGETGKRNGTRGITRCIT